jgi:hypothetical protein
MVFPVSVFTKICIVICDDNAVGGECVSARGFVAITDFECNMATEDEFLLPTNQPVVLDNVIIKSPILLHA